MLDLSVQKQLPVITSNFEEVKASLMETISKYQGIIVTEDGLQDCKATQKELAGIRVKIDNYRKEVKKEMSKPIDDFESNCKALIKLVEDAEKPIKDGIAVFDTKKKEEKKEKALSIISEVVQALQLNEKYAKQLTVIDKYCNLTAKASDVKTDVEQRALLLLNEQNKEAEMLEILKDTVEHANKELKTPMKLEDFKNLLDMNMPTGKIINEINKRAEMIKEAEKPKPEPKEEPKVEPVIPVEVKKETPVHAEVEEDKFFVVLRVVGNKSEIAELGQYLQKFNYTKINSGKV